MSDLKELQPLHIEGLADYHCHCDYSIDAVGSIDEYCEAALLRELAEICFTTHFDSNPKSDGKANFILVDGVPRPSTPANLAPYVRDVIRAREKYFPLGLSVKLGVEFGWYPNCEETVRQLKQLYDLEYVLCGLHEIEDRCFCCRDSFKGCFERYPQDVMAEKYFQSVIAAARSGLFHTIAHLDYYKKYGESFYGSAVREAHRPFISDLFTALMQTGTALEINTASRRRGFDSYYPSMEIVNSARRSGVDVVYLGSDAHAPAEVGFDFEAAALVIPAAIGGCDD